MNGYYRVQPETIVTMATHTQQSFQWRYNQYNDYNEDLSRTLLRLGLKHLLPLWYWKIVTMKIHTEPFLSNSCTQNIVTIIQKVNGYHGRWKFKKGNGNHGDENTTFVAMWYTQNNSYYSIYLEQSIS